MTTSIKYLVVLGLIGAWVARKQQRRGRIARAMEGGATLASLVPSTRAGAQQQRVPTAENPFPEGNPALVPTGPAPGG